MEYRLIITRGGDGEPILDKLISADEVIGFLRPDIAELEEDVGRRHFVEIDHVPGDKKVRRCGKCGKPGHRADSCEVKKKSKR